MGEVIISIDAELVGGGQRSDGDIPRNFVLRNRQRWTRLIELFDDYDIPATWAIMGRLFEENRDYEYPKPADWFEDDQTANRARHLRKIDEGIAAPDLVDSVDRATAGHEVGIHSYSHIRFSDVDSETAATDVTACMNAVKELGFDPVSFVYPYNDIDHRDVLTNAGFRCYRGTPPSTPGEDIRGGVWQRLPFRSVVPSSAKRLATRISTESSEIFSYTVGGAPPLVSPKVDEHGLVAIPSSLPSIFRLSRDRPRIVRTLRDASQYPIVRTAKQGIDAAADDDGIFHMWFHPFDFQGAADFEALDRILEYLDKQQQNDNVEVVTMRSVADRYIEQSERDRSPPSDQVKRTT